MFILSRISFVYHRVACLGDTLRNMYKIKRTADEVTIFDWNGKIIYHADTDSILLYEGVKGVKVTNRIDKMSDEELLLALAKAVKLDL